MFVKLGSRLEQPTWKFYLNLRLTQSNKDDGGGVARERGCNSVLED